MSEEIFVVDFFAPEVIEANANGYITETQRLWLRHLGFQRRGILFVLLFAALLLFFIELGNLIINGTGFRWGILVPWSMLLMVYLAYRHNNKPLQQDLIEGNVNHVEGIIQLSEIPRAKPPYYSMKVSNVTFYLPEVLGKDFEARISPNKIYTVYYARHTKELLSIAEQGLLSSD